MNDTLATGPGFLGRAINGLFASSIILFLLTILLRLLHHVYGIYLWLKGCVEKIRSFCLKTDRIDACDEIRRTVYELNKVPSHLVLILGPESPSYHDIVQLITWCLPAGIAHLSLYDHKDELDCWQLYDLFCNIAKQHLHRIKWGKSFDDEVKSLSKSRINGYSWSPAVTVHVLRLSDGIGLVTKTVREVSAERKAEENAATLRVADLRVPDVDRLLRRHLHHAPDPEMAIICGPTFSFYGCCPWNMRITQMQLLETHTNLTPARFLFLLHEYNNCHQRYGK